VTATVRDNASVLRRLRLIPLCIAVVTLLAALWGGFLRLGWQLPGDAATLAAWHGALMISGVFGTLISLERAVAIGRAWVFAAPALSAFGAIALLVGEPALGGLALLGASLVLTLVSSLLVRRMPALFMVLLAIAAGAWSIGNALWLLGRPTTETTGWWLTFLVLTIAAERLELSRLFQPPRWSQALFVVAPALVLIGAARGELARDAAPLMGTGLLLMTLWLVRYDIARRTVRQSGPTRFSACCLLGGYVWLGVAGGLLLFGSPGAAPFGYDAVVHAIAIGFVLSMVFGHAPIILPAITGLRVGMSAAAYAPLALLHASLALRIGGDLLASIDMRKYSAALTVLALAGYAVTLIAASLARRSRASPGCAGRPATG
jgi:hypothetical protein